MYRKCESSMEGYLGRRVSSHTTNCSVRMVFVLGTLFGFCANMQYKLCVNFLTRKQSEPTTGDTKPIQRPTSLQHYRQKYGLELGWESQQQQQEQRVATTYSAAAIEAFVLQNVQQLGLESEENPSACAFWLNNATNATVSQRKDNNPQSTDATTQPMIVSNETRQTFATYVRELHEYGKTIKKFSLPKNVTSLVQELRESRDIESTCDLVDTKLVESIGSLSLGENGYMEPLLPPLRHPKFCHSVHSLYDLSYLLHDWRNMCQQLTPYSRIVFVDMGASLAFHSDASQPAVYLTEMYRRFGLPFDHIYAYEITPTEPSDVFSKLPEQMQAAYHWINVGVDPVPGSLNNPFTMLKNNFGPDDLIVVKLDVDNSPIEMQLSWQLLSDPVLQNIVDHFYFEHHVHMLELSRWWVNSAHGSVANSLDLFSRLRQAGIAAHYWV